MRPPQQKPVIARGPNRRRAPPRKPAPRRNLHRRGIRGFGRRSPGSRLSPARAPGSPTSGEEIRRDGEITQGREATRDVADMIVEAENLLRDQNDRTIADAGGLRQIDRRLAVSPRDARFQRLQPGRGGRNLWTSVIVGLLDRGLLAMSPVLSRENAEATGAARAGNRVLML